MEKSVTSSASLSLIFIVSVMFFPLLSNAISKCNGPCRTPNDCDGELICIRAKCIDDPEVGSNICGRGEGGGGNDGGGGGGNDGGDGGGGGNDGGDGDGGGDEGGRDGGDGSCQPSGTLSCNGKSFPIFSCSPPVTSFTKAKLTNNDFSEGGDGGSESKCDGRFHDNSSPVVALSTGWFNEGSRCGKMINIKASNGRSVTAKVVDECDSMNGCDSEHAGQALCPNNIVDGSDAVWRALGLDTDIGVVDVTWSMA